MSNEDKALEGLKSMSSSEKKQMKENLQNMMGTDLDSLKKSINPSQLKEAAAKLSDEDKKLLTELLSDKKKLQEFISSGQLKKKLEEISGKK